MKKFAYKLGVFASAALLAMSVTACGGDDEDDDIETSELKVNDESCQKDSECKSGYCNDYQLCADKPSESDEPDGGDISGNDDEPKEGECFTHDDCKDKGEKTFCGEDKVCIEPPTVDGACEGVTCDAGSCVLGICVTSEMDALQGTGTEEWPAGDEILSFCTSAGKLAYKNAVDGAAVVRSCAGEGVCSVYDAGNGILEADCSGTDEMIAKCGLEARVQMCSSNNRWYGTFLCPTDLTGKTIAIWNGDSETSTTCEAATCAYGDDGAPTCGE